VRRAINIAFQAACKNKPIEMLGDIVHNEDVVKKIEAAGIKKIRRLERVKNKILLIRAHGATKDIFLKARRLGYRIIDATCPMVKEIHKIAKDAQRKGYSLIVIGDKRHDEVLGIIGNLKNKALVIDGIKNIPLKTIKKIKRAAIVVQSTQDLRKALEIADYLMKFIPELKFFNTICKPTRTKQEEIRLMPEHNDIMIILGSKNSANTRRLYEISKSINKRSYWINSRRGIQKGWFKNAKSVGISAGASTPETTIQDVIGYIKKITAA
ncbi:MAG: 4-hydroxy-3-methylbut-2-enyl diphosphate reductase, partial [Candidatus Omnitrophica bacterium]|nr:4-hydroxy-3-methylbut-2-enyl diphosphate reductase [Candidatus Omnitrophota bacterium]